MIFEPGDIWDPKFTWRVIPTNKCARHSRAIMGKGLAAQAESRSRGLSREYAIALRHDPTGFFVSCTNHIICLPTKYDPSDQYSDFTLIRRGLTFLAAFLKTIPGTDLVAVPKLGTGLGRLQWKDVCPLIKSYLKMFPNVIVLAKETVRYQKENQS